MNKHKLLRCHSVPQQRVASRFCIPLQQPVDSRPGSGMWPAVNHVTLKGLHPAISQRTPGLSSQGIFDYQSQIYPHYWLGQWTRSDTVDGSGSWGHEGYPGNWTWAFPALCTHNQ